MTRWRNEALKKYPAPAILFLILHGWLVTGQYYPQEF